MQWIRSLSPGCVSQEERRAGRWSACAASTRCVEGRSGAARRGVAWRGVARRGEVRAMARGDRALEERMRRAEAALAALQQRVDGLEQSVRTAAAHMERLTPTVEQLLRRLAAPAAGPPPPPQAATGAHQPERPLVDASTRGDAAAVEAALQAGADVTERDDGGDTPLHSAVRACSPEAVRALLAAGAPVNARNRQQWTPLHVVAWGSGQRDRVENEDEDEDVLRALLEAGAALDLFDADGNSALVLAAAAGRTVVLQLLLRRWSPPFQVARALERARDRAVVETLLQGPHPPFVPGQVGGAALRSAARDGRLSALRALLEARAPVGDRDARGYTAAHHVALSAAPQADHCAWELRRWGAPLEAARFWDVPWVVALLHLNLNLVPPLMPLAHVPPILVIVFLVLFVLAAPKNTTDTRYYHPGYK